MPNFIIGKTLNIYVDEFRGLVETIAWWAFYKLSRKLEEFRTHHSDCLAAKKKFATFETFDPMWERLHIVLIMSWFQIKNANKEISNIELILFTISCPNGGSYVTIITAAN